MDELLLSIQSVSVCLLDVGLRGKHELQLLHGLSKHADEHLVVVRDRDGRDFRQTFQRDVTKHRNVEKFEDQCLDQLRLEDVTQRDPVEKAQQSFEGGPD